MTTDIVATPALDRLVEEIRFRREGRCRLSTFAQANEQVYANAPLMKR